MDDAVAGVQLVTSVLRLIPAIKNATRNVNIPGTKGLGGGGTYTTNLAQGVHPAPPRVDSERERRAYETVNYVLRTLGSRIGEAGLVSVPMLSKALTEATMSIDVKLFSTETNRLFESLASKLNDPILVNSVFTSIYLISFLTAELQGSLPNYKDTYTPLGPRLVQQLFMTAIGQDAFRENQTANLDAYQTLARTAGLLRPTDLERATFPGFPSFRPNRYSSKTFKDTRSNRMAYERLVKHFDIYGFPQPVKGRDVGEIRDWRFLSGDANTRAFEVEKADKHIGENFGRVLHWLICSADRMPPGEAVIAYLDQHIELIKWMGPRMGYCAINAATDIKMAGNHAALKKELRDVFNTWVILMPSESAKAKRRQSSAQWAQIQQRPQPSPQTSYTSSIQRTPSIGMSISPISNNVQPMPNIRNASVSSDHAPMSPTFQPNPLSRKPTNASSTSSISTPGQPQAPQSTSPASVSVTTPAAISVPQPTTSSLTSKPPISSQSTSPVVSPPPYSPNPAPVAAAYPFPTSRPASVVRRKAPPRPKKKLILAKALDDFEPEDDNDRELPFKEGEILEIVEKSAALEEEGWCRAKLKDSKRIGLAPLEYLEELGIEEQQALQAKHARITQGNAPGSQIGPPASGLGTGQEIPIQPPPALVHELPSGSPHLAYAGQVGSLQTISSISTQTSPALTAHGSPPLNASVSPNTAASGGHQPAQHGAYSSTQNNMPTTSWTQSSQFAPNINQSQCHSNSGNIHAPSFRDVYPGAAPAHTSNLTQSIDASTNSPLSTSPQNNASNPNTIQNASINHGSISDHNLSRIEQGIAPAALSHQSTARPSAQTIASQNSTGAAPGSIPTQSARPLSHGPVPSGRPPAQVNQSHQSTMNKIFSAIQNATTSNTPASAAGPTTNFSNQTTYSPPQAYGATHSGQSAPIYGPMYTNPVPPSPYPMAPQPMYGYPPDQSMYNTNSSSSDAMMQMLAMQSLTSITQPSTVSSPPATDPRSYNNASLSTLGGVTTDPGLTLSGTPANIFGGQNEVDNSSTDPTADATAITDTTADINNLSPGVDSNSMYMIPPPNDLNSLYMPPPAVDPSIIDLSNPTADVAATDPFYTAMNPGIASQPVAIDPNRGMISPLASLDPDPSAAGITSVSAGYITDPTISPLAGLAPSPDASMISPLAGLMPDPDATASSGLSGTAVTHVTTEDTTIVQQDTTVYDDSGTTTDQQFADDEVGYVMDATACSEDWDAS